MAGVRILLVEDDHKLGPLLGRYLTGLGNAVTLVATGDAALRELHDEPPDFIVLDVMIPHPDGLEVCRYCRSHGWRGPIIAISALTGDEHAHRSLDAGADVFLAKPFGLRELVTNIDALTVLSSPVLQDGDVVEPDPNLVPLVPPLPPAAHYGSTPATGVGLPTSAARADRPTGDGGRRW